MSAESLWINTERAVIGTSATGIKDHKRPERVAVEIIWSMQKPLGNFRDKRQLIKILYGLAGVVGDDLAVGAAPYQAVHRGKIGAASFRFQPVPHCVFVLAKGDCLQRRRHRESFLGK